MKLSPLVGVCATLIALGWQANALAGETLLIHGHIYTLADLAVLSQDIFAVPLETIGQTRVVTTMVGGKIVYGAKSNFNAN
jgi:hypothetical protein